MRIWVRKDQIDMPISVYNLVVFLTSLHPFAALQVYRSGSRVGGKGRRLPDLPCTVGAEFLFLIQDPQTFCGAWSGNGSGSRT